MPHQPAHLTPPPELTQQLTPTPVSQPCLSDDPAFAVICLVQNRQMRMPIMTTNTTFLPPLPPTCTNPSSISAKYTLPTLHTNKPTHWLCDEFDHIFTAMDHMDATISDLSATIDALAARADSIWWFSQMTTPTHPRQWWHHATPLPKTIYLKNFVLMCYHSVLGGDIQRPTLC